MAFLNEGEEVIENAKPSKLAAKLEPWLIRLGGAVVVPDDLVTHLGPFLSVIVAKEIDDISHFKDDKK